MQRTIWKARPSHFLRILAGHKRLLATANVYHENARIDSTEASTAMVRKIVNESRQQENRSCNLPPLVLAGKVPLKVARCEYDTINTEDYEAEHVGYIRMILLNSPGNRNAISRKLLKELGDEIEKAHDPQTKMRALVIATEVDSVFCAGADLKERKTMTLQETRHFLESLRETFHRLETVPIPTISCISGAALGGGLELALCTHIRYMTAPAVVGLPETKLGILPGAGGTYRLPRLIGKSNALALMLMGNTVGAKDANDLGLCTFYRYPTYSPSHDYFTKVRLDAHREALQIAHYISTGAPLSIRALLHALKDGGSPKAESKAYASLIHTEDRWEALKAFEKKRPPVFTGK